MSEFTYKDYCPANARVIVDYSKDQKVKFSYPIEMTYWQAVWKRTAAYIFVWWLLFHLVGMIFVGGVGFVWEIVSSPEVSTDLVKAVDKKVSSDINEIVEDPLEAVFTLLFCVYLLGTPLVLTYIMARNKEWFSNFFPQFACMTAKILSGTKGMVFEPKDIVDNKAIVPYFKNVFLEYNATDEFGEYLEKIEVLEYPFHYLSGRTKKKIRNDCLFRAVFYFKESPKRGELKVEFI